MKMFTILKSSKVVAFLLIFTLINAKPIDEEKDYSSVAELMNATCPTEQPKLCLPYGTCCRISEYCFKGHCETCLPVHVRSLPKDQQLTWCRDLGQNNFSLMASTDCRLACLDIFSLSEMTQRASCSTATDDGSVQDLTSSETSSAPHSPLSIAAIVLSCFAFTLLLILIFTVFIYIKKNQIKDTKRITEAKNGNLENRKNLKKDFKGKEKTTRASNFSSSSGTDSVKEAKSGKTQNKIGEKTKDKTANIDNKPSTSQTKSSITEAKGHGLEKGPNAGASSLSKKLDSEAPMAVEEQDLEMQVLPTHETPLLSSA